MYRRHTPIERIDKGLLRVIGPALICFDETDSQRTLSILVKSYYFPFKTLYRLYVVTTRPIL